MWQHVGLFRDSYGLEQTVAMLEPPWLELERALRRGPFSHVATWHAASLLTVGRLIARAALRRTESRGAHYRADHPHRDDIHWKRRVVEKREGE
jgi:succinate dehydrogenase/fumarate reductase flavoprotein subunit